MLDLPASPNLRIKLANTSNALKSRKLEEIEKV